ncbi:MAG: biopolymer transporter ExbD [Bdellovibrionales bacterium]|nr:biopolymer transporter ExbD [Bdellovibrionales bacterium]
MRRKSARSKEDESAIDLTPMLDVVFIMLIFFIVTTSFVKESGIEVNRPQAATAQKKSKANILIAISKGGEIWVQKRKIDVRSVRANVERMHAESPEGAVVIQADKESRNGLLVQVMDQVRLAGVTSISLAASHAVGE